MEKPSYYAITPANVRYDKDLTANAKLLYGEITALCNEKGFCWATNDYFAKLYNVNKISISRWINQLVKKNYLDSNIIYKDGTKEIESRYLSIVPSILNINKNTPPINKIVNTPINKIVNTPINKIVKDNNTSINNTSINNNNKIDHNVKSVKSKSKKNSEKIKNKIESVLDTTVTDRVVDKLLTDYEVNRINYYLDNWDKFSNIVKKNKVGFFIDALKNNYDLPIVERRKATRQYEFEQRKYNEDDWKCLFKNC